MQVVQGLSPYTDFPTRHPLYIGQTDRTLGNFRSIRDADLMLSMGAHALYQDGPTPIVQRNWKLIEAASVPNDLAKLNPAEISIVANVKETAKALVEALS